MPESRGRLEEIRKEIDSVDRSILDLLNRRMQLVSGIMKEKAESGISPYDPQRENGIIEGIVAANNGPLKSDPVRDIYSNLIRIFRSCQYEGFEKYGLAHVVKKGMDVSRKKIVVGDLEIGGDVPVMLAGPCAIESEDQFSSSVEFLAGLGVRLVRAMAYKPRTSPYSFQGTGIEGLKAARRIADRHGVYLATEILDSSDIDEIRDLADLFWIGARNMGNVSLLKKIGAPGKPVVLKRAPSATIEEWLCAAEYVISSSGNTNVILCERGIRTFETETRNTLDISAVALVRRFSKLPVIVDVSHSLGRLDVSAPVAKAALAAGADGIVAEVHPNPEKALSDGGQQFSHKDFAAFYGNIFNNGN